MKLNTSWILLFFFSILISACEKNTEVMLRVENVSSFDFKNVFVDSNGSEHNFGDLKAGERSEYVVFDIAYRYGFISLNVDTTTYQLVPIDYVGESPLESGKYTYQIDAFPGNGSFGSLGLELKED